LGHSVVKAKFHYAIQVADPVSDLLFNKFVWVCDQLATFWGRKQVADRFRLSRHMEFGPNHLVPVDVITTALAKVNESDYSSVDVYTSMLFLSRRLVCVVLMCTNFPVNTCFSCMYIPASISNNAMMTSQDMPTDILSRIKSFCFLLHCFDKYVYNPKWTTRLCDFHPVYTR